MKRQVSAAMLVALIGIGAVRAQEDFDVVVHADEAIGEFKNLLGVTCGPLIPQRGGHYLTSEYKWMGVPSVRIHDCETWGDLHTVFPNMAADPNLPASYDFRDADRLVNSICQNGMRALYRLGYSFAVRPPPLTDLNKLASICEHIVLHYTQGWANGYRYGSLIEWEVWNEPNLRSQWPRSAQDFRTFYGKAANAVRRAHPRARVGTCALAVNWPGAFQEKLIEYCATNSVPLDFFSWHYYGWGFAQPTPHDYARHGRWVRSLLDRHGLQNTDNYLTEWNITHPSADPRLSTITGAAYCLSAVMFLQDGHVDLAHHYRGDICRPTSCGGLFYLNGSQTSPTPRATAFHLFSQLMKGSSVRLRATGSDRSGFAAAAGRSITSEMHQVLLSDFWSGKVERRLLFRGLPRRPRRLEVFRLTEAGRLDVSSTIIPAGVEIEHPLPTQAPWVQLIRLTDL